MIFEDTAPSCRFKWYESLDDSWLSVYSTVAKQTLLQSPEYGLVMAQKNYQKLRWAVIEIDGVEAGCFQIQEAKALFGLFHAFILDRGPLWKEGFDTPINRQAFFDALAKNMPKRLGRRRRIFPECDAGKENEAMLIKAGFKKSLKNPSYETLWWSIAQSEDARRAQLRKNWRYALNKAEKSDIKIEWDGQNKFLKDALAAHMMHKLETDFKAPDVKLIIALAKAFAKSGGCLIGRAINGDDVLGYVLFFLHGRTATYQLSVTTKQGRAHNAMHFLLFSATELLKEKKIAYIDLGGLPVSSNEVTHKTNTNQGLTAFKKGTGATYGKISGIFH